MLLSAMPALIWLLAAPGVQQTFVGLSSYALRLSDGFAANTALFITIAVTLIGALVAWRTYRVLPWLGLFSAGFVLLLTLSGLVFYFTLFDRHDYREMTRAVAQQMGVDDALLMLSPAQHPLARYYFAGRENFLILPEEEFPAYFPIKAKEIIPEEVDDQIKGYLRRYPAIWLLLDEKTGPHETRFVVQYLTAVAHKAGCVDWEDSEVCRFVSPQEGEAEIDLPLQALFHDELLLRDVQIRRTGVAPDGRVDLLASLNWEASNRPEEDYKVSLRLLDAGGNAVGQHDDFPIGALLPPTTWAAGDVKPGYMLISIDPQLPAGVYMLEMNLYDPNTLEPVAYRPAGDSGDSGDEKIRLATLTIDEQGEISLAPMALEESP
jgi:hypothetical protein